MGPELKVAIAVIAASVCAVSALPAVDEHPSGDASRTTARATACVDSDGNSHSEGAAVAIRGHLMRCVVGPHWVAADPDGRTEQPSALDVSSVNVSAVQEAEILRLLAAKGLARLECDTILDGSSSSPAELVTAQPDQLLLVLFWTPSCDPCKPLLRRLAQVAKAHPLALRVVGVVQAFDPELEAPGEWALQRVKAIMRQEDAAFPTCVHSSNRLATQWQPGGVPLLLLVSNGHVGGVALGRQNGEAMLQEAERAGAMR